VDGIDGGVVEFFDVLGVVDIFLGLDFSGAEGFVGLALDGGEGIGDGGGGDVGHGEPAFFVPGSVGLATPPCGGKPCVSTPGYGMEALRFHAGLSLKALRCRAGLYLVYRLLEGWCMKDEGGKGERRIA
jgi:hypothetical protein